MIKRLRIRFALTAIFSVLLVFIILFGGINTFNYQKIVADSDKVLMILSDNGGKFPKREDTDGELLNSQMPPEVRQGGRIDSPELQWETRYFSVEADTLNNILSTDTGSISAISEETAQDYALTVLERSSSKGFIGDYRYVAVELENGNTLVIFCDCGIGLLNFRSFRDISIIISAVSLILISIKIFLISGRAVRPVAESYEKQIRFITDAGHEIKTPLSIIIADTDVLEMDLDDGNEWIKDIKKQTERLTELTNNLVYLSKMEEGNNTLVMEKTDISAIAHELSDSFKNVAIASNKKLLTEINEGVLVNCDRKSMRELFSILLDNAIKYSPESESITFKVYKNSRNAVIAVSNRAKENISNENLAHLFDRFYRTDGSRNSETGGHGLGLAIAKSIVANNKGSITAFKSDEDIIFTCKFQLS